MKELPPFESDELYLLVRHVLRLSRRFSRSLDEPLESAVGLNMKEMLVLSSIIDGFDTPTAVAEQQNLPAPTVTRLVTKLVDLGLLERLSDPSDLRRQRLALTELGWGTRDRTRQEGQRILHERFGQLNPAQLSRAVGGLRALEEALAPTPASAPQDNSPLHENNKVGGQNWPPGEDKSDR